MDSDKKLVDEVGQGLFTWNEVLKALCFKLNVSTVQINLSEHCSISYSYVLEPKSKKAWNEHAKEPTA